MYFRYEGCLSNHFQNNVTLVSEAQKEHSSDCCVPIKSKWQSDLGEAQRGYIFSQAFSQGPLSFLVLLSPLSLLYLFDLNPTPVTRAPGFCRVACFAGEPNTPDIGGGLSAARVKMRLTASHHLLIRALFFVEAVSIKCYSLPSGWWEECSTQLLKVMSRQCFGRAFYSLSSRMKRALFHFFWSALCFKQSGKVWWKEERRPPGGRDGGCSQASTWGSTFFFENLDVLCVREADNTFISHFGSRPVAHPFWNSKMFSVACWFVS